MTSVHARHATFTGLPPGEVEERARAVVGDVGAWMWQFEGHHGLVLLADEARGRCIAISLWEDEGALERSGTSTEQMRTSIADLLAASVEEVGTYSVVHWDVAEPR